MMQKTRILSTFAIAGLWLGSSATSAYRAQDDQDAGVEQKTDDGAVQPDDQQSGDADDDWVIIGDEIEDGDESDGGGPDETAPIADNADGVKMPGIIPTVERAEPGSMEPVPSMVRRSFGGNEVLDRQAPWQAQIFQPWGMDKFAAHGLAKPGKTLWELQHLCGGALIAPNWVLTAAHCLPGPDDSTRGYKVRLGAENIASGDGSVFTIDKVVLRPGYQMGPGNVPKQNDIALVHFAGAMPNTNQIATIAYDRGGNLADGTDVFATGWGRLETGGDPSSKMLRVDLKVQPTPGCQQVWRSKPGYITASTLCASAPGKQTCQGDSGGPLITNEGQRRIVGIVSWNNKDCFADATKPDIPGVYTRVASHAAWIDSIIR